MKQIVLSPERPWKDAKKTAEAEIKSAGGVVLVAKTPRARRNLEKINREYQFPRRHHPESPPETWPRRSDEIAPRTFWNEAGDRYLLLSFPDHKVELRAGVPVTD